jgi:DNA-binding response OmpR family regulator
MRILIVEDDVMVALSMDETLSEAGHLIVGLAREEVGAMRIAAATRPDLALVDLKLARRASGAVVARHLRERHGIPCVFVSGSPGDCQKIGIQIGVLGCLAKPFAPDELVEAVDVASTILQKQNPERVPPNMQLYFLM